MKRLSNHDLGNFDWQARYLGASIDHEPTLSDVQAMVEGATLLRPTKAQYQKLLGAAQWAYKVTQESTRQ